MQTANLLYSSCLGFMYFHSVFSTLSVADYAQIFTYFFFFVLTFFSYFAFHSTYFFFNALIFLKHANCQTHGYRHQQLIFACDNDQCTVCNNLMLILEISDGPILID